MHYTHNYHLLVSNRQLSEKQSPQPKPVSKALKKSHATIAKRFA